MSNDNQFDLLQSILSLVNTDDSEIKEFIERQVREQKKIEKPKEISNEIIRRLRIQNKKLLELVDSLKDRLKYENSDKNQIRDKLTDLENLNKSLAQALGSCEACWGDNPDCDHCSGQGLPGWKNVNRRMFYLYVLPALEKLLTRKY
ncbi:MAG: hypothetical protein H7Y42_04075 [Chitinophagaceae bacterium]|nr:hypothetical protein [Chitinophagaceae bacterium]